MAMPETAVTGSGLRFRRACPFLGVYQIPFHPLSDGCGIPLDRRETSVDLAGFHPRNGGL